MLQAKDEEGDGRGLSDEALQDNLITLLFAGYDTTSITLTLAVYLLSRNPAAYQKLKEVFNIISS